MKRIIIILSILIFCNISYSQSWPINGRNALDITSTFGPRHASGRTNNYDFHRGIDIRSPEATPVYAVNNGNVILVKKNGQNSYVLVDNLDGTRVRYVHITPSVKDPLDVDDTTELIVKKGVTQIGTVCFHTAGPHLDFKYYPDGFSDFYYRAKHPLWYLEYEQPPYHTEQDPLVFERSDENGKYLEVICFTYGTALDLRKIELNLDAWSVDRGYFTSEILKQGLYVNPIIDFDERINCGDGYVNDSDSGVHYSNDELWLKIVPHDYSLPNPTPNPDNEEEHPHKILSFRFYLNEENYSQLCYLSARVDLLDLELWDLHHIVVIDDGCDVPVVSGPGGIIVPQNTTYSGGIIDDQYDYDLYQVDLDENALSIEFKFGELQGCLNDLTYYVGTNPNPTYATDGLIHSGLADYNYSIQEPSADKYYLRIEGEMGYGSSEDYPVDYDITPIVNYIYDIENGQTVIGELFSAKHVNVWRLPAIANPSILSVKMESPDNDFEISGRLGAYNSESLWNKSGTGIVETTYPSTSNEEWYIVVKNNGANPGPYSLTVSSVYKYSTTINFLNGGSGGELIINDVDQDVPYTGYVSTGETLTIGAPIQTVPVNERNLVYNFLQWDQDTDLNSNPLTLTPDDHFDIEAVYKGHMVSNNSQPTGADATRCIVRSENGMLHMVYEDDGQIYYTGSTDGGLNWSAEELVSSGNDYDFNENPAITISRGTPSSQSGYTIHVVYSMHLEYEDTPPVSYYYVCYSYKSLGQTWSNEEFFYNYPGLSAARPSVYAPPLGYGGMTVCWRFMDANSSEMKAYAAYHNPYNWNWESAVEISGVNGDPVTVTYTYGNNDGYYFFLWDDGNYMKMRKGRPLSSGGWIWQSINTVKTNYFGYPYTPHKPQGRPSVAIDNWGQAFLTWLAEFPYPYGCAVCYNKYDFNSSSPQYPTRYTYVLKSYNNPGLLSVPSISVDISDNDPAVVFTHSYYGDPLVYKYEQSGSSWSSTPYAFGSHVRISDRGNKGIAWTEYNSAPYFIKTDQSGGVSKVNSGTLIAENVSKRLIFSEQPADSAIGYLAVDIDEIKLEGQTLELNDSLSTNPFEIRGKMKIEVHFSVDDTCMIKEFEKDERLLNLVLYTDSRRHLIKSYSADDFLNKKVRFADQLQIRSGKKQKGYLQFEIVAGYGGVVNYLKNSGSLEKAIVQQYSQKDIFNIIPENFSISQNYPNPLNPTTHIMLDLPEGADVKLEVYNIRGQKVAVLIDGYREAGSYEVLFDGRRLASGVYFYRVITPKFTAIKRMLLVK